MGVSKSAIGVNLATGLAMKEAVAVAAGAVVGIVDSVAAVVAVVAAVDVEAVGLYIEGQMA